MQAIERGRCLLMFDKQDPNLKSKSGLSYMFHVEQALFASCLRPGMYWVTRYIQCISTVSRNVGPDLRMLICQQDESKTAGFYLLLACE